MEASPAQLAEYEKQLADVEELLKASPEDESVLSLKNDLMELVALTKDTLASTTAAPVAEATIETTATAAGTDTEIPPPPPPPPRAALDVPANIQFDATTTSQPQPGHVAATTTTTTDTHQPKKKSSSKSKATKEFEVPHHLIIKSTDSEKEVNRKKRAVKQLKRKHKEAVKEEQSNQKQKSWQNFNKKKKIKKDDSIFSTHAGDSKVGVVGSGRKKTDFGDRTRHNF